ncbi:MAG: protein kinase domain-containing protein [Verrucomicrobiales bacterium]
MRTPPPGGSTTIVGGPKSQPEEAVFAAGDRIAGRYTIEGFIGAGGMGMVFRARQDLTNKTVALKVLRPRFASGPLMDRFLEEIQLLGRLNHPGVARIHDADVHPCDEGQVLFYTMDLVDGLAATDYSAERQLGRREVLRLLITICEAVQYAHDHGVVHCDLKPANVLVHRDGSPVVVDFGLARLMELSRLEASQPRDVVAEKHPPAGTPAYMSPEQFVGGIVELRAGQSVDVYSLGVLAFEMLSGCPPFDFSGAAAFEDFRRIVLFESPRRLGEVIDGCEPELDRAIAKAMRKDPADRYFSIASFQRALQRLIPREEALSISTAWRPAVDQVIPSTQWVLDEKLGEGGVGEVWLCHHRALRHKRIVKFCADEEKAAFLRRELTLYKLLKEKIGRHEHFVPLEEVSLDEAPYYLMAQYIEARDFAKWCAAHEGTGSIAQPVLLEIIAQAAEALQSAHDVGVLHRDVKPSNLLVRGEPDNASSIHVWVSDFGIGQVISDELLEAHAGGFTRTLFASKLTSVGGTQLYLAPELTAGGEATVRSDIYALGVVLFQTLVGDFQQPLTIDWRKHVGDPLLCDDLERCLAGNPSERFVGAGQLADHLRRLGERRQQREREQAAIVARERAAHRRGVLKATAFLGTAIALVAALAGTMWRLYLDTLRLNALSVLSEIKALRLSEAPHRSNKILERFDALRRDYPDDRRAEFRKELVAALAMASLPFETKALHNPAETVVGHSDCWQQLATMGPEGRLTIYSVDTVDSETVLTPRMLCEALPPLRRVAISEDGALVVALEGPNVLVWDGVADGVTQPVRIASENDALLAACHANGLVAVADPSGRIEIRKRLDGYQKPLTLSRAPPIALQNGGSISPQAGASAPFLRPASALAFSSDGQFLAVGSIESLNVLVWDVATGELVEAAPHTNGVVCVVWNPNTLAFATGCENGRGALWRVDPAQPLGKRLTPIDTVAEVRHFDQPILSLSYNPKGTELIAISATGQKLLMQAGTLEVLERIEAPDKDIQRAGLAADGSLLFQNREGHLCLVNAQPGVFASTQFDAMPLRVEKLSEAILDSVIAVTTHRALFMVDLRTGRCLGNKPILMGNGLVVDPAQGELWVNDSQALRWWKTPPLESDALVYGKSKWIGEKQGEIGGGGGELDVVRVQPEACLIATSHGERLKVYRHREDVDEKLLDTTKLDSPQLDSPQLDSPQAPVVALALHPNGVWLAALRDGVARAEVWKISTRHRTEVGMPDAPCLALAWAPSGEFLAIRNDKDIAFFKSGSWELCGRLTVPGPPTGRPVIAWSRDGNLLATTTGAGDAGEVELFDVAEKTAPIKPGLLCTLQAPRLRPICALRFCGDASRFLVAGTTDGHVQTWDLHGLRHQLSQRSLDWADGPLPELQPLAIVKRVKF